MIEIKNPRKAGLIIGAFFIVFFCFITDKQSEPAKAKEPPCNQTTNNPE
nr:MAG TPA: hypothetical protein [Caudoviricetes sp.]